MFANLFLRPSGIVFACTLSLLASSVTALAANCALFVDKSYHCYVMMQQTNINDAHGVGGLFTEPTPTNGLSAWPWDDTKFSVGQLALISEQPNNVSKIIEFGWIVDKALYGDIKPHLFAALRFQPFKGTCFIGIPKPNTQCRDVGNPYIKVSNNIQLGDPVGKTGQPMMYHIGYYGQNACGGDEGWWIQYGNEWIGCVKNSWFKVRSRRGDPGFPNGNRIKWYGEVVYGSDPCIPMGNGMFGTNPDSVRVLNMFYERDSGSGLFDAEATLAPAKDAARDTRFWNYGYLSRSTNIANPKGINGFHYGGAGSCGAR